MFNSVFESRVLNSSWREGRTSIDDSRKSKTPESGATILGLKRDVNSDPSNQHINSNKPHRSGDPDKRGSSSAIDVENEQKERGTRESSSTIDVESVQKERKARVEAVCANETVAGNVSPLHVSPDYKVSGCIAHKAASTYWIQVFKFISNDGKRSVSKPSDFTKYEAHLEKSNVKRVNFYALHLRRKWDKSFRFMTTRDPYERLWSVYIDKYVLFDNWFWVTYSKKIRLNFHQAFPAKAEEPPQDFCFQISFEEFIFHIVTLAEDSKPLDDHIRPIHLLCNPCMLKPHFIAKVETLTREKGAVLKHLGVKDEVTTFEEHSLYEMENLIQFQFDLMAHTKMPCLSLMDREERVVKAFILNGYLKEEAFKTLQTKLPLDQKEFSNLIIETFKASSRSPEDVRNQREEMKQQAYKTIADDMLRRLKDLYRLDFKLFGYHPQPPSIFENRTL